MGAINVADILTMQDLANGHLDVKALGEAANGDENTIVTTRTGNTYPSAERAINIMFQNGGLPAKPFPTLAKMGTEGASLADGQLAMVYNETANNGLYVKTAGAWVKSDYDPAGLSSFIDSSLYGDRVEVLDFVPEMNVGFFNTGAFLIVIGAEDYRYSDPIFLESGMEISFNYYGAGFSPLVLTDEAISTASPLIKDTGTDKTSMKTAKYKALSDCYVSITTRLALGSLNLSIERKVNGGLFEGVKRESDVSYDYSYKEGQIASADVTSKLDKRTNIIENFIAKESEIGVATNAGAFILKQVTQIPNASLYTSLEVTLKKGDTLKFKYLPIEATILWHWLGRDEPVGSTYHNIGFPLLSHTAASDEELSYSFVAYSDMEVRITNTSNAITINDKLVSPTILSGWAAIMLPRYSYAGTSLNYKVSPPFGVAKGDKVVIKKASNKGISLLRRSAGRPAVYTAIAGQKGTTSKDGNINIEWVADSDCLVQVSGMPDAEFSIRRKAGLTLNERLTGIENSQNTDLIVPTLMELPEKEMVFATSMNFILKTEMIGDTDYIKISQDLGKTWTQIPNTIGDIVTYHFFSDGTIMLCSPTKVFWTRDYLTLNESAVFDHDGSVFVPTDRHFFAMQTGDSIMYIDDQEIFVWGDYADHGYPARIWYSLDRGRTIKCAALYGTTIMDGSARKASHTHRIYYHKKGRCFYITTGDYGNGNMIIKAVYDVPSDTWDWKVLNSGEAYKMCNLTIDDNDMAFILTDYSDYNDADIQNSKGIYRVHVSDLGDISKYQRIYHATVEEWGRIALLVLVMDKNGNKIIFPDYLGAGYIWVAREGLDFKKVTISQNILLTYVIGENYNGDIYCVDYRGMPEMGTGYRLNRGSYNITKMMRNAGIKDFMRGTTLVPNLSGIF